MEAAVLLPKQTSLSSFCCGLGKGTAGSAWGQTQLVKCHPGLTSQIWTCDCRVNYDSAEFLCDSLDRHRERNFGTVFFFVQ